MFVPVADFEAECGKYLEIAQREDVYLTLGGFTILKVVNPRTSAVGAITGILRDVPEAGQEGDVS